MTSKLAAMEMSEKVKDTLLLLIFARIKFHGKFKRDILRDLNFAIWQKKNYVKGSLVPRRSLALARERRRMPYKP